MILPKFIVYIALSASAVAVPATAQVVETFATFGPAGNGRNVTWDNNFGVSGGSGGSLTSSGSSTTIIPGSQAVRFSFVRPELMSITNVTAAFTLNGVAPSGNPASSTGSILTQGRIGGSFAFTSIEAYTIGNTTFAAGSNLFTGTFQNASISGFQGGTTASFVGFNTSGAALSYTSDFLDLSGVTGQDFIFSLTSVLGTLSASSGDALRDFNAVASGSFSAAIPETIAAVPEPGTWAMMIVGFGMVGGTLRYRRQTLVRTFA